MKLNKEANAIALAILGIIDNHKREDVMAALTCASGRALASIGVPTEAMGGCMSLFIEQVLDHHALYLEKAKGHEQR